MSSSGSLWYVGVALEIVSTMSGTLGKLLIRFSEVRKAESAWCSKIALVTGLVVNTAVGPIVDMAAYSFAAQSLIAPFGGMDVVWNAMLAPYILQETLTPRRLVGCALIVVGTAIAGTFANHEDPGYTIDYIEETLVDVRVLIYFVVFLAWFLVNRQCLMRYPKGSAVRGISLGCTAGTIAGNMFCVKAAVELIQTSIRDQDGEVWFHWLPYALLLGAAFFALTNVVYMTQGLREFEALFMVTIYEGSMIVSGCVSGAVVLLDLRGVEPWRVLLYALGVLLIVAGMYAIFSQEAMNRSSLRAGTASIDAERPKLARTLSWGACAEALPPAHCGTEPALREGPAPPCRAPSAPAALAGRRHKAAGPRSVRPILGSWRLPWPSSRCLPFFGCVVPAA